MAEDVDKSLLERLQALRGGSGGTQSSQAPQKINIDVIERAKTPSREDALTARLRSLREGSATPEPEGQRASLRAALSPARVPSEKQGPVGAPAAPSLQAGDKEEDIEHIFETDDDTLQELLADVTPEEDVGAVGTHEPSDEQVKALLEQLADEIPKGIDSPSAGHNEGDDHDELDSDNDDDSDSEAMKRKVNSIVERYSDEAEMEAPPDRNHAEDDDFQDPHDEAAHNSTADVADLGLPSVPSNLQDLPSSPRAAAGKPDLDDMTARMARLRALSSHKTGGGSSDDDDNGAEGTGSLGLPDVPTSHPSAKPPLGRLQSRTRYTDDDVGSWCTVCLEDATLRCLGCDNDVYCTRCWREMHMGLAAAFDDCSHRAVQFTRDKRKKRGEEEAPRNVALGA